MHVEKALAANRDAQDSIMSGIFEIQDSIDKGMQYEVEANRKLREICERYETELKEAFNKRNLAFSTQDRKSQWLKRRLEVDENSHGMRAQKAF